MVFTGNYCSDYLHQLRYGYSLGSFGKTYCALEVAESKHFTVLP